MSVMASKITCLTIIHSTAYSDAVQRKHQSSASLAFVRGIHRWPVNSVHKGPVTQEMVPFWWRHHDIFSSWYLLTYTTFPGLGETTITSTCDWIARGSCLRSTCLVVVACVHSGTHCPQKSRWVILFPKKYIWEHTSKSKTEASIIHIICCGPFY